MAFSYRDYQESDRVKKLAEQLSQLEAVKPREWTGGQYSQQMQDTIDADAAAASSKYYSATLAPANWSASGSVFKYTYSNTNLRASVSPVVSCTENAAEYAYITDAEATAKTGIVFTARKKPTANIILTIVDVG